MEKVKETLQKIASTTIDELYAKHPIDLEKFTDMEARLLLSVWLKQAADKIVADGYDKLLSQVHRKEIKNERV